MHETPLLDKAPPPRVAHGLSTILLTLFGMAVVFSALVPLPESVEAPFVVVTEGGGDPVVAPEGGQVEQLAVAVGDEVIEGALLLSLRSAGSSDRAAALLAAQRDLEASTDRSGWLEERLQRRIQAAEVVLEGQEAAVAAAGSVVRSAATRVEELEARLATDADLHEGSALSERQVQTARLELESGRMELADLRGQLSSARAARDAAADELVALRAEADEKRQVLGEQTAQSDARLSLLSATGTTAEGVVELRAPCAGEVVKLELSGAGAWVGAGQTAAHVACLGQPLLAEVAVPTSSVGRIAADQPVRLRYDAFPYLRYGLHRSSVGWIAPAGIEGEFLAQVAVPDEPFEIAGGQWPVRPGMTGSAEIVLARRPAITWAFEPLAALWDRWFL